jgi:hypothetical protein
MANGGVDVTAAVEGIDKAIADLQTEIDTDDLALRTKKARLNAMKKGRKGLEAAVSDDIEPVQRPGRRAAAEPVEA